MEELVARVRRAGASGEIVVRFDSGYWSNDTIAVLGRLDVRYTMAVRTRTKGLASAIAAIDEKAWVAIAYTAGGEAQVAECLYNKRRLVVRRTRLIRPRSCRSPPSRIASGWRAPLPPDPNADLSRGRGEPARPLESRDPCSHEKFGSALA